MRSIEHEYQGYYDRRISSGRTISGVARSIGNSRNTKGRLRRSVGVACRGMERSPDCPAAFFVGLAITFPFIGHSTWQAHKAAASRSPRKQLFSGRAVGFLHLRYKPAWLTAVFMSFSPRTKSSPCLSFVK